VKRRRPMCTRLTGWRKSSYSHFEENACVEVRHEEGVVGIRDTKQAGAHREVLVYPADAFAAFLEQLSGAR